MLSSQEVEFIKVFYSEYGLKWVSSQLSLNKDQITNIVKQNNISFTGKPMAIKDISTTLGCSFNEANRALHSGLNKIKNIIEHEHKDLLEVSR